MKLSIVVPFYNELRTLPTVIDRLLAVDFTSLGITTEILFIDDGSTDNSHTLLDPLPRADCRLITHPENRGKGAAVKTGLEAATGDILCIQDADLEYHPQDLPALVQPILDGEFDVVYGNRFKGSAAGLYYTHRIANRLLNTTVNVLFNRYLADVYTGYKVFTRHAFEGLTLTAKTFTVEMELTAHFLRRGLVIYEVPISYRARTYAQGKKIHFKDGFLAVGAALRYRFQPRRDHHHHGGGPVGRYAPDAPGAVNTGIHARGLEDLATAGAYRRYIAHHVGPHLGPSVLQVKAGLGDLTAHLAAGRQRVVAAEDDPVCIRGLEGRFAGRPEVEVAELDLGADLKTTPPVDSVLAVNVIEYLDDDVTALRRMAAAAVPGGSVVLMVAGYPALAGAYERAVGQRRYTPDSLRTVVERAGLTVERLAPVNLLGGLAWWLAVRVGGVARPTPALVSLYDRVVVPAERLIERRAEPPFGQSLLCVARVSGQDRASLG